MSGDIHIGDSIHQSGAGSIGKVQYQGPVEQQAALREMIRLATELRARVGDADRDAIDEFVDVAEEGERTDQGALRQVVSSLITVAAKAGAVGTPLLDAALKVKALFSL
jgi:hypothetical protein